jgi:putative ABC transport system ATP-binding protein
MENTIIKLENIEKSYILAKNEILILKGINLDIKKGEFLAIMGPSGSGKSTTMNMIGSLDMPTKGTIFLDGQDISKLAESKLAQLRGKKIGFIFQNFNLIPSLSALQNVTLPLIFQGIPKNEAIKRAKAELAKVKLDHRITHKPSELSGGEKQRVAIARALVTNSEIILADEPTGNLDSKTGEDIMKLLQTLNEQQNKTVIVITHDSDIANRAKRVIKIQDGRIVR